MADFDDLGQRIAGRFKIFASAVAGQRATAAAAGVAPRSLKMWQRCAGMQEQFHSDLSADLEGYLHKHMPDPKDVFKDRGYGRYAFTLFDVRNIASQVIAQSGREAALGPKGMNLIDATKGKTGAIGLLVQERLANPTFKVRDSAGREWDAHRLVHVLVRNFAYQTFIDGQFVRLIESGRTETTLVHPNDKHELHGVPFSTAGESWLAQRDQIFHINSNLTIEHGTVSA